MAASGYTPILIYSSGTTGNTPSSSNLTSGSNGAELALNYYDGKLFYKDASGNVQVLATKGAGTVPGSNTQVIYNNSGAFGASSSFTYSSGTLTLATSVVSPTIGAASGSTLSLQSNGTTNATLDTSGNLGLGVTPTGKAKFEVYTGTGSYAGISTRFNATNFPISFGVTNANGVPYLSVNAQQVSGTDGQTYDLNGFASRMWCNGGGFAFFTAPSGTAGNAITWTQAMTLNASGQLGIGTTSPNALLHVAATSAPRSLIQNTAASGSANGVYSDLQSDAASGSVYYRATRALDASSNVRWAIGQYGAPEDTIAFYTGTSVTERMRLDSNGNLGLGVTPSAWSGTAFQIKNAAVYSYNGQDFRSQQNIYFDGTNYRYITANPGSFMLQYQNTYSWYISSGTPTAGGIATTTQAMTLDASGNLLVGTTTSPTGTISGHNYQRLGIMTSESAPSLIAVSTSAVQLTRSGGFGGFAFVIGYNNSSGAQQSWLLLWNSISSVNVVGTIGNCGLTVTFSASSSSLYAQTSSGTLNVEIMSFSGT